MSERYPVEILPEDEDNGTMPSNVQALREAVVGHRIVSAEKGMAKARYYGEQPAFIITLDDGRRVQLVDDGDCCAYTGLEAFLLHAERVDHVITGVGTTNENTRWHIYADLGDVLEMKVGWSPGNAFYYGYGFDISVQPAEEATS